MADDDEFITLNVPEVFVYKIPPKTSAGGHKASDWKDQVWAGKLQVVTKGKDCLIKLIGEGGKLFASAPIRKGGPPAVEKVSDSSRYFALRIENAQGVHAFIGVGFNQRSDAFDFNVALQEWQKEVEREEEAAAAPSAPAGPSEDFTLKAGQTFTIKVAIDGSKGKHTTGVGAPPPALPGAGGGGGIGRLAPPPGGAGMPRLRPPPGSAAVAAAAPAPAAKPAAAAAFTAPAAADAGGDDLLGLGGAFASGVSVSAPAPAAAAGAKAAAEADPWGF